MAWVAPVTTWTSAGYMNFADFNRIEANTDYLRDYITTNIGTAPATTGIKTDWDNTGLPYANVINKLEGNVQALRNIFTGDPTGWQTLITTWKTLDAFDYADANRIETDLGLLKTMAENVVAGLLYCGDVIAGEGGTAL